MTWKNKTLFVGLVCHFVIMAKTNPCSSEGDTPVASLPQAGPGGGKEEWPEKTSKTLVVGLVCHFVIMAKSIRARQQGRLQLRLFHERDRGREGHSRRPNTKEVTCLG